MHKAILFSFATSLALWGGQVVFEENFESGGESRFAQLECVHENPGSGAVSAHGPLSALKSSRAEGAYLKILSPIAPDKWYRLTFRHRNDVRIGQVAVRVQESRVLDKVQSDYYAQHEKSLPLNMPEWHSYSYEFKTLPTARAIRLHLVVDNEGTDGCAWWDDLRIEEIQKTLPPLSILPFRAAGTYTDIPTRRSYIVTDGNQEKFSDRLWRTNTYWETMDLSAAAIAFQGNGLPEKSLVRAELSRAGRVFIRRDYRMSGNDTVTCLLGLDGLPEGKYLFTAMLLGKDNAEVWRESKEIWRVAQKKIQRGKLEPIKTTSAGPDRQVLVNGKVFHPVHFSQMPCWGQPDAQRKHCKPDLQTYLSVMKEQFGVFLMGTGTWRAKRWNDQPRMAFIENTVKEYRAILDFCAANDMYAAMSFDIGQEGGGRYLPTPEEMAYMATQLKDHPALYSWALDEPEVGGFSPEQMMAFRNAILKADPNHLVCVNLCDPQKFMKYASCSDIGSFDVYPFPTMSLEENETRMAKLHKAFPTAPLGNYLQGFNFPGLRMPTFDEVRAELVQDCINECHSLRLYAWGEPRKSPQTDPEFQSYLRPLLFMFRELQRLHERAAVVEFPLAVSAGTALKTKAYRDGDDVVLLAVNLSGEENAAATNVRPVQSACDFFDGEWKCPVADGKLSLALKPSTAQVLRLRPAK